MTPPAELKRWMLGVFAIGAGCVATVALLYYVYGQYVVARCRPLDSQVQTVATIVPTPELSQEATPSPTLRTRKAPTGASGVNQ